MRDEIDQLSQKVNTMEMDWWIKDDLFSLQWWVIVIVNVFFFALFLFFIDRKRTLKITVAFLIGFSIVGSSDEIGDYFHLWSYPHEFIPFSGRFNAVDFFVIPSIFALMYQKFRTWRSFLIADVIISSLNSYIGERIFVLLGIYKLNNWTYTKSFLVLFVIAILIKAIVDSIGENRLQVPADREVTFNFFKRKQKV
jgi:hypothetical protein